MAGGEDTRDKSSETDDKLHDERERTNDELLERSSASQEDADEVIHRARERARTVLEIARIREDRYLARRSLGGDVTTAVASERVQADQALELEQASAEAALDDERTHRLGALVELLATEREETDHALAGERDAFARMLSARDDVLAGVGHDIRGHLSIMMLNASVIALHSNDREIIALTDAMLRSAAQMNTLVGDLLDVAIMDSGELVIRSVPGDLVRLVRSAVELNAAAAAARSVELTFAAPPRSIVLQLDAPRLARVVMNLLSNAIKFVPAGGRVAVSVKRVAGDVEVAVTDNGPGIPTDQLEAIFEKFRRTEAAVRKPGYGLGLYISRAIVHAHRGRIWAETNEPGGATFSFRLPSDAPP